MNERYDFAFARSYRLPALLFGVRPGTAVVTVTDHELRVRFGPWRLATSRDNIAGTELTEDFAWFKTAGPAHLSLADRGITFATNGDRALCVSFAEPVPGIDPTGVIRHPTATLTVADPEALQRALL
ncbi:MULTISPECIES: hypothetical protein [unclassified Knoellia]|uniref:hypothetical protein n=1 Tax=Knoellia altitudinis TaxID=3404795 RepID=UPI0036087578